MDPLVAAALEALRAALAKSQGRRPAFLQLLYPDGSVELLSLPGESMAEKESGSREDQGRATSRSESDTERAILAVLEKAERALKARSIAARAHLHFGSYLRGVLAEMVKDGRLIKLPEGGYWLAGRPRPDARD